MKTNYDMQLSRNFTLRELTKSDVAIRNGISNAPTAEVLTNLKALTQEVLQPVRDKFGLVRVTSGYRSPQVNRLIGGSARSHHCRGMAADFEVPNVANPEVADWVYRNLQFTQCILEFYEQGAPNSGWIHVSYDPADLRGQILTATRGQTGTVYSEGFVV